MSKQILIHNSKKVNNNFHLISSLWHAFCEIPELKVQISQPQSLNLFIKSFQPDIIIFFGGEDVSIDSIKYLKSDSTKWVLWTTEDPFEIKCNKLASNYFDVIFTSDRASKDLYDHPNCHYLPLGASKNWFYHPVIEKPEDLLYDLIFIGTAWPNRSKFLKDLISLLEKKHLKSRFVLPTNPYIPTQTLSAITSIEKFERDFRVAPKDLAKLQNYSRFALTLFRDFSGDGSISPQSSPTNRFYETALAGTGQIIVSNHINISQFYPDIKDYIFQSLNAKEVVEIIIHGKENPETRNSAASTVQQFVLEKHSYLHRAKELLAIVNDLNN